MKRWEGMPDPPSSALFSSRKNPLWPSVPDPAHSSLGSWVPTIMAEVRTWKEREMGLEGPAQAQNEGVPL